MERLLLLSLASSCLGTTYVQNLPMGTVVFGTEGEFVPYDNPYDCVLAWKERGMLPKTLVYNYKKKTCTPLRSVHGTKKAMDGEEAYFIESSQDICQRNVTKAVEDITEKTTTTKPATTTTIDTTTTEAPWSQEVVLIREPEAMVHYFRKDTPKKVYRNYVFYESKKDSKTNLYCNEGEKHCLCNEALECGKFSVKYLYDIILRGECDGK
uniref:Basic tail protein n=1 Tax=Steinernema glaseri TaxID=37863 RepID=A0A1I7Z689_9BILA